MSVELNTSPQYPERYRIAWEHLVKPIRQNYSQPTRFANADAAAEHLKEMTEAVVRNLPTTESRDVLVEICQQAYKLLFDEHQQHGWPIPATLLGYVDRARGKVCPVERDPENYYTPPANTPDSTPVKKAWTLEQARSALRRCDEELADPEITDWRAGVVVTLRACAKAAEQRALANQNPGEAA